MKLLYTYLTTLLLTYECIAEEACKMGAIDLVFVLDESGSVGQSDFEECLKAASDFTSALEIGVGDQKSRVGLTMFSSTARLGFHLDDYTTNKDVETAIKNSGYEGGFTDIAGGMNFSMIEVFDYHKDAKRTAPKVMLLMIDGQDNSNIAAQQKIAASKGIVVYALGVRPSVNISELILATGDKNKVFIINDYSGLSGAMRNICVQIVPSAPPITITVPTTTQPLPPARESKSCGCEVENLDSSNYWLDIIFIVDSSSGVSREDFTAIKQFLILMRYMNIDQTSGDPQYTRIGIINNAASAVRVANLTTIKNPTDLENIVANQLTQSGGIEFNAQAGLRVAADMLEEEQAAHRRDNVRKVVVMFSSASIDCRRQQLKSGSNGETDVLCELVSVMQDNGVVLVTVGLILAGETEYPYIDIADKCNQLDNTEDMTTDLLLVLCRANCFCLAPYTQYVAGQNGCDRYAECVYVNRLSMSSVGADEACQKEDSIITPMFSRDKNDFLKELHLDSGFYPFWIGVNCTATQCTYSDGIKLQPNDYKNWCTVRSQPDFSKGNCVYEKQCENFKTAWYSEKCGNLVPSHYFSCQKESCSVNKYCEYSKNSTVSTRKVLARNRGYHL